MPTNAADLAAVISYMINMSPDCLFLHSWRVALLADRIATIMEVSERSDIFYAALLHDIGDVGSSRPVAWHSYDNSNMNDAFIRNHSNRSANLIETLPGMHNCAEIARLHHERIDGTGYPNGLSNGNISVAGQILSIANAVIVELSLNPERSFPETLRSMARHAGRAWVTDVWAALLSSTKDAEFYREFLEPMSARTMLPKLVKNIPIHAEMDSDVGVERLLYLISALVDLKDPSTSGHSLRVAKLAKDVAMQLGLSDEEIGMTYRAGLVHDCGRLGLPSTLLNHPGRLNDAEMTQVREHAQMTVMAFFCIPDNTYLANLGYVAGHDHERYDGKGYPDGLSGESIPIISRILSASDAYDAMVSVNNYRMVTERCAVLRLEKESGKQFDPFIVEALVKLAGESYAA